MWTQMWKAIQSLYTCLGEPSCIMCNPTCEDMLVPLAQSSH